MAQEELRRQRDQLEEEKEDTEQDSARARRELERRYVASGLPTEATWMGFGAPNSVPGG